MTWNTRRGALGVERVSIFAIDPGPEQSAWVIFDGSRVTYYAIEPNHTVMESIRAMRMDDANILVLEQIESFGMAVGREVFETVFWTGRFYQAALESFYEANRLTRKAVKLHLCGVTKAKDANVRVALMDKFGGSHAKGTKKAPGPLYGVSSHCWAALAVAVTWYEQHPSSPQKEGAA